MHPHGSLVIIFFEIASGQELLSDKLVALELVVVEEAAQLPSDLVRWAESRKCHRADTDLIRIDAEL